MPVQINPQPQAVRPTYQRQPSASEIQAVENRINDIENNMKANGPEVSRVADWSSCIIDRFSDFEYKDLPSADSSEAVCVRLYNLFLKEFDRNHMEDFVKKLEANGVRCHRSIEERLYRDFCYARGALFVPSEKALQDKNKKILKEFMLKSGRY